MTSTSSRLRSTIAVTLSGVLLTATACGGGGATRTPGTATGPCESARDLHLVNGRIVTMDGRGTTVDEVTIQDGRFTAVGPGDGAVSACTQEIDLGGRTAVPGLIDNHNHIVLLGIRPGHHTPLEGTATIAEVQEAIRARAAGLPAGTFITSLGGWNANQFAERRLPTLEELDGATADHPVLVFQSFTGPAATNTPGREYFTAHGVAVGDDGAIGANAPSMAALNALRADQTLADRIRGAEEALAYAASVGVTTSADMGAFNLPGTDHLQDSFEFDTLASADQFRMYDAFMALHRQGRMRSRLRIYFLTMDTRPDVPLLSERLRNDFNGFGDDMLRVSGIGEFASNWPLFGPANTDNYETALSAIAEAGWAFQQHSLSPNENELTVSTFEAVNARTPIADLRWSLAHVGSVDTATLDRLKAMGAAVAARRCARSWTAA